MALGLWGSPPAAGDDRQAMIGVALRQQAMIGFPKRTYCQAAGWLQW